MTITIEEFEVLALPDPSPAGGPGAGGPPAGSALAGPAQLQQALALWTWLSQERELRLDDR